MAKTGQRNRAEGGEVVARVEFGAKAVTYMRKSRDS